MAATVYTGSGDWSYTNSTGGNVRVIVAYCWNNQTNSTTDEGIIQIVNGVTIGQAASGSNQYFRGFGKHITYYDYISGSSGTSLQMKNISGNVNGTFADEFFLANGQTAALQSVDGGKPIRAYNIMVIPEGN